jgi:hypothetical protein
MALTGAARGSVVGLVWGTGANQGRYGSLRPILRGLMPRWAPPTLPNLLPSSLVCKDPHAEVTDSKNAEAHTKRVIFAFARMAEAGKPMPGTVQQFC